MYIAASDGVFKRTNRGDIDQVNNINTNAIYFLASQNKIISAGNMGVYVWDLDFNLVWKEDIPLSAINGILKDPNSEDVWIGTSGSGVLRLKIIRDDVFLDLYTTENDGLHVDQIVKPIVFEDSIKFGGGDGLLRFIDETEMKEMMKDYLTEEELNDPRFIRGMFEPKTLYDSLFKEEVLLLEEEEDKTWYVANHKLGYFIKKDKSFINKPFWGINYGRINNLYLEDNGDLWIGCADGLIRYRENERKNYKSQFSSLIRQIIVSGDTIFNGTFIKEKQSEIPTLNFSKNNISFLYSCPYFEDEHKPEYSYILEGNDNGWSEWTSESNRVYTNLTEGRYTFKVKAKNIYDQISEVAEYTFVISPPWYRTAIAYFLYAILFFVLIFIANRISSMRLKAKNEELERVVEERTKEISQKNDDLEVKNTEISEQKREIEDSINYAKRIQDAILPLEDEMKKWLPKSFVFYRPKDIVSGDFYWFTKNGNKFIIVCADCTGHGVPGAFMSMIGSDRLNIIVNERNETSPGNILSELNRAIKKSLKQEDEEDSTRDGMDAAICMVDLDKNEMVYAGAYRPLWIMQNGDLSEVSATKVAIAGLTPTNQVFKEHTIKLETGMKFYMTTDGFADQFGGVKGKKYMIKKLKRFIKSVCNESYADQQKMFEKETLHWMNDYEKEYEQIDDICILGFEL